MMSSPRSAFCFPFLILAFFTIPALRAQRASDADKPQDAAAGFTIEKLDTSVRFAADGTSERTRTLRVKLESDAAVRSPAFCSMSYNSENEQLVVDYVRVRKADGSVVETPQSNIQETASPVTSAAPMYSDLRVKQIPVRALANGDWLEYQFRWVETKPMIPNQFWYEHDFMTQADVKEETLTIRVPSGKYVKLSNPGGQPQVSEENGDKVYFWKTSYTMPGKKSDRPTLKKDEQKPDEKKAETKSEAKKADGPTPHSVELTTFHSWDEVGKWYGQLAADKVAVTPEIQAKADELTKGLTTVDAREHALYDYVSTRFRYISVSFGEGRYQPHSASEVMANLYGDCKDKHTLLSSLLKASGIESSAVLIGSELPFNADIPSPAQFNHVITLIPASGSAIPKDTWLDTTPEISPFGQLIKDLRNRQALVIPSEGAPHVATTSRRPVRYPIPRQYSSKARSTPKEQSQAISMSRCAAMPNCFFGWLSAETPPGQWADLAQQMSMGMGYGGTVSAVDVDNPQDTSKPFHYGWDYRREKYADWEHLQITAPLPGDGTARRER